MAIGLFLNHLHLRFRAEQLQKEYVSPVTSSFYKGTISNIAILFWELRRLFTDRRAVLRLMQLYVKCL